MRALLTPYPQRAAGVAIFTPGTELMGLFSQKRLLISTVPEELANLPDGKIQPVIQSLVDDQRLQGFFAHERVIRVAGGMGALKDWLKGIKKCQWELGHDSFHTEHLDTLDYGTGAVRLCWHHENKFREHVLDELDRLANQNRAEWIVTVAARELKLAEGHQLSFYELCWWAFNNSVLDFLPDAAARYALHWKPAVAIKSVGRESEIVPEEPPKKVLVERAEAVKAVLYLAVDPETPETFYKNPKSRKLILPNYTRWVKAQQCCGCGNQADDPHHITGRGLGGMGMKASDLHVIPLCRRCHDDLHANTSEWEAEHGSQDSHLSQTLARAAALGVISVGKAK